MWEGMKREVVDLVLQCLYCADPKAGNMVPRPLGKVVQNSEIGEMLMIDFSSLGLSDDIEVGGLIEGVMVICLFWWTTSKLTCERLLKKY